MKGSVAINAHCNKLLADDFHHTLKAACRLKYGMKAWQRIIWSD
jgi:hypothetical protein